MSTSITQEYPIREPQNAQEFVNLVNINTFEMFDVSLLFSQVQNTIGQIQDKFGQMSDSIMAKSKGIERWIANIPFLST